MVQAGGPAGLFDLTGRNILVTGAREGIGYALAKAYGAAGANLVVSSRDEKGLRAVLPDFSNGRNRVEAVVADLSDLDQVRELARRALELMGTIDVLVNNAGIAYTKPALEHTWEEWDETFRINLDAPFILSQAIGRHMVERGRGKIINVSSTFAKAAFAGRVAYAVTKAALSHLTRCLALEWAPYGVTVNAIAPCATRTPSREVLFADPAFYQRLVSRIPLGRVAETSDLVGAAIFLASSASDFITGQTLYVDGGYTL